VVNAMLRPPYPQERYSALIVQKTVVTPRPVWTCAENLITIAIRCLDRLACITSLYLSSRPRTRW